MDLNRIRKVGVAAAYSAAGELTTRMGKLGKVRKKGAIDLVTEADEAAEKTIIDTLRNSFPEHAILSEESGLRKGSGGYRWIIDPLDGTTNFVNGLGIYSISIAFAHAQQVLFGVVLSPCSREIFTAVKGEGAFCNGRPIAVSQKDAVCESLLVTGFPYDLKRNFDTIMRRFTNCVRQARGIRRLGSAALDFCYVACGRFDGYWEQYLQPWDMAAGALIAAEAGARVTDFSNGDFVTDTDEILVTNGLIHKEMLSLME